MPSSPSLSEPEHQFIDAICLGLPPSRAAVAADLSAPMAFQLMRRPSVKAGLYRRLLHLSKVARRASAGPRPYVRRDKHKTAPAVEAG
jgi:hypothetical protein